MHGQFVKQVIKKVRVSLKKIIFQLTLPTLTAFVSTLLVHSQYCDREWHVIHSPQKRNSSLVQLEF